jgi:hypothetical protein
MLRCVMLQPGQIQFVPSKAAELCKARLAVWVLLQELFTAKPNLPKAASKLPNIVSRKLGSVLLLPMCSSLMKYQSLHI